VDETRIVRQPSVKQEPFLDVNKKACYALPDEMKPSVFLKEVSALARKRGRNRESTRASNLLIDLKRIYG
jgi:hypothetical protein